MALFQILHDVTGYRKSKIVADKPEIHIFGVFQDTVFNSDIRLHRAITAVVPLSSGTPETSI